MMTNLPVSQYQDKDDALHFYPGEKYYEWWYLDAQFDNGYSCVITFHYRLVFAEPHMPCIQLHIYAPGGKKQVVYKPFEINDVRASEDHCDVQMGDSFVRQENGAYKVSVHTKGGYVIEKGAVVFDESADAGAELIFRNILPGWKPEGTGILLDKGDAVQGWVVPIPRAEVEGTLFIGETAIKVKGNRGYHDHNWGNTNIYDFFSGWYWGRLYDDKYTLIYGWVYPVNKKDGMSAKLYLARENKPILITEHFKLQEKNIRMDEELNRRYAGELVLASKDKDVSFKCSMQTKSVVEKVDMSAVALWPIYYWRFLADYKAEIKMGGRTEKVHGETLHEYMLFK